jgi:hypothetical protein
MSDIDRDNHFQEKCSEPNTPLDPCLPIKPQGLHTFKQDPCNPEEFNECRVDGFETPGAGAPAAPAGQPDQIYYNETISLTCSEAFGDAIRAVNYDTIQVVVEAKEFSSFISQADADAQAEAVAISRLNCNWGNELLELDCPVDSEGNEADGGEVVVEEAEFLATFSEDGTPYNEVAARYQKQADDQALAFAQAALNCYWNNDERDLFCHQLESLNHLRADGTNDWYTNGKERLVNNSIFLEEGTVQSFLKENPDAGKADANAQAIAFGEGQLVCLFENLKLTLYCCEPWSQDQSKNGWTVDENNQIQAGNLPEDDNINPDGLQYYYDNHSTRDQGPTEDNSDIYVYDEATETSSFVLENQVVKLPAKRDENGLTKRCNNPFIDDHYDNLYNSNATAPVTIEAGVNSSPTEGDAFQTALTIAQAQLECAWTNDYQPGAECPTDPDGYPVDPRSPGSKENLMLMNKLMLSINHRWIVTGLTLQWMFVVKVVVDMAPQVSYGINT